MRVLVMGAGAVGGYYGAQLARHGHDVTFVARGAHLAAMRASGLTIRSREGTTRLAPVRAVETPGAAGGGTPELVLFTVKGHDTDQAAQALHPVVGAETTVLTLQNGVDSEARLTALLGPDRLLAGTTTIEVTIAEPGVIDHASPVRRIVLGEPSGGVTARVVAIAGALREAGVEVIVSPDPRRAVWEKFVRVATSASLTTACQATIGEIRETPEGAALYRVLIAEAVAVGRGAGVPFPADAVDAGVAFIMGLPRGMKTSMQRDYERLGARDGPGGGRVELEELAGAVVRHGRALGVATPSYDVLYGILKIRALGLGGLAPATGTAGSGQGGQAP